MLIILPSPNSMEKSTVSLGGNKTTPLFHKEAEPIVDVLKQYSVNELAEKFQISSEAAQQVYDEYRHYDDQTEKGDPAILSFNDEFYNSLKPSFFTPADSHYAQQVVRILNPFYGLLRPLDLIKRIRASFSLKLHKLTSGSLSDYWRPFVSKHLASDVVQTGNEVLCFTNEELAHSMGITEMKNRVKVVFTQFREWNDGKLKEYVDSGNMAKAALVSWIIRNKIVKLADIKNWSWRNFKFDAKNSDTTNWYFVRA